MRLNQHLSILLVSLLLVACSEADPKTIFSGQAFASQYHITLRGSYPDRLEIHDQVIALFKQIDEQASTWRDDSWLATFNAGDGLEPVAVPEHVWAMLVVAEQVYHESGGALDVTCGPLVTLWGFGPGASESSQPPSEMQIAIALVNTGMDKLVLDHERRTITQRSPGVTIDLSALAKGYAIDQVAAILDAHGIGQYLIEFGGEVLAKGAGPGGEGWVIQVEGGTGQRERLVLRDEAVATSGTSQRHRALSDGQQVSHLIDPRSGKPVQAPSRSVSVVASSGVLSDAWATVLAIDQGPAMLEAAERAGVRVVGR